MDTSVDEEYEGEGSRDARQPPLWLIAPAEPPRQTQDQKDRKLRALDKVRAQILEMQPLINLGEKTQWGAWNSFATSNERDYLLDLQKFRDDLDAGIRKLNELRDQSAEYDDIVSGTRLPDWESWVQAASQHLVIEPNFGGISGSQRKS